MARVLDLYIDESSQTKHRYLVLGGIVLGADQAAVLEGVLLRVRQPELPHGELGWTKVSRAKLAAYERVVDTFFDNAEGLRPFEFHSLVVDCRRLKDDVFNGGSREVGFSKEVFQLCMKFARLHAEALFHAYLDSRETKSSPEELRFILNRALLKRGDPRSWPFRRVHFRDSGKCQAIQLVDVLLGGLAYRMNGHHEAPDASPAKLALSARILDRAGIVDPLRDTAVSGKFTVWHRKLA